eukprot:5683491-Amphidinium_carterae.1
MQFASVRQAASQYPQTWVASYAAAIASALATIACACLIEAMSTSLPSKDTAPKPQFQPKFSQG